MASTSSPVFSVMPVSEVVKREVPDWDEEVVATARFKAFSGQRSDWEPCFFFWRDLILKVARNLGVCVVRASELKYSWFSRGALTPLCIDQVMHEMHVNGDIYFKSELIDPTSGRIYRLLRQAGQFVGIFGTFSLQDKADDRLIIKILLQERASDVIKTLAASNWTSTCVITMKNFESHCKNSDESSAILSYLCENRKAYHFSAKVFIEGVKLSLDSAPITAVTELDNHVLHLTWTTEKLQQQIVTVDQRLETSRKKAVASLRSGNKQTAYRHIRQAKLLSEKKTMCTSFLDRVEEVLAVIADAESTKKVSEAMQIGVRAIKANRISVEELNVQLQELDEFITDQKQINESIERISAPSLDYENELVEEFERLEMELADEIPDPRIQKPAEQTMKSPEPDPQIQNRAVQSPESLRQMRNPAEQMQATTKELLPSLCPNPD